MNAAPSRPPRRAGAGFTLLEVAIMLAVLVVLCSLAVPQLGARLQHQRLQATAEALAADLADARFEAARRGQTLHLESSAGPAWCWAVSTTPGCGCSQPQVCQLHRATAADHAGVRLLEPAAVQLDAAGAAHGTLATTLESARGERLQVAISPMGRTRICASAGNWPRLQSC